MPADSASLTLTNNYTAQSTFDLKYPIHRLTLNVALGKCILQVRDQLTVDFPMVPQKEVTLGIGYNSIAYAGAIFGFRLKNAPGSGTNAVVDVSWTG